MGQGEAGKKSQAKSISSWNCQQVGNLCHLGESVESRDNIYSSDRLWLWFRNIHLFKGLGLCQLQSSRCLHKVCVAFKFWGIFLVLAFFFALFHSFNQFQLNANCGLWSTRVLTNSSLSLYVLLCMSVKGATTHIFSKIWWFRPIKP